MGLTVIPASPNGGILFATPVTFNASGTFILPSTAIGNSQIMIESIGGGGAGGRRTNQVFAQQNNDSTSSGGAGAPGSYFIGAYRLGFLYSNPAGQSIPVTVGAGGTGASYFAQTINGSNQFITVNGNTGNGGGTSSVTLNGVVSASAAGGAYEGGGNTSPQSSFYVGIDNTLLANIGPIAGRGGSSSGTLSSWTNQLPLNGRSDFGVTASGAGANSNNTYQTVNSGPLTPNPANDATPGTGAGGGSGGSYWINTPLTTNHSRGGAGASPGGGGGGITGYGASNSTAVTYAANNTSGAGGSGRVRIWLAI
jgi:hypothetical protein